MAEIIRHQKAEKNKKHKRGIKIMETKKQQAIQFMKKLNIYKPYITGFEKENTICYFENFSGFWAYQNPQLMEKVKEIENKHNCLVYAVTHEFTEFGECYDMLIVTNEPSEWGDLLEQYNNNVFYTFAYVYNATDKWCSEFGTIAVESFGGGIKRIG